MSSQKLNLEVVLPLTVCAIGCVKPPEGAKSQTHPYSPLLVLGIEKVRSSIFRNMRRRVT